MTISPKTLDGAGNQAVLDGMTIAYDAMTNAVIPVATRPSVTSGTGVPTFSAPKGSIYTDLTAAGANLRMYINTNGTTGWGAVTSA